MFDWLDRLREKPEHVRLRIALMTAGLITLLIIFVWLSLLSLGTLSNEGAEGGVTKEDSPFKAFGEFWSEGKERLSESWEDLRSLEYTAEPLQGRE